MLATGTLQTLDSTPLGTHLTATTTAADTVLHVDAASVFSPTGGSLDLDGVTLAYTSADVSAGTVTLAAAVGAIYEEGFPVTVTGALQYRADITPDDPDAEPIVAVVPPNRRPSLPDEPAPVEVEYIEGQWVFTRVIDREAAVDASTVQTPVLSARRTADANVSDSVDQTLTSWTVESSTSDIIAAPVSGEFAFAESGHYMVLMTARWALNSTGRREVWPVWHHASGDVPGPADSRPAEAITGLSTHITDIRYCEAGDAVSMVVKQTSGAALTLRGGSSQPTTTIRVFWVGP